MNGFSTEIKENTFSWDCVIKFKNAQSLLWGSNQHYVTFPLGILIMKNI